MVPEVRISGVPLDLGTEDNRKMSSETDESLPEDEAKATENEVMEPETKLDTFINKIKDFFKKMYAVSKSLLGLSILLVLYSIIGMIMFHWIEYEEELDQRAKVVNFREKTGKELFKLNSKNLNETEWIEQSRKILEDYEEMIRSSPHDTTQKPLWNMWGSLFFCATIYTTIGKLPAIYDVYYMYFLILQIMKISDFEICLPREREKNYEKRTTVQIVNSHKISNIFYSSKLQ